MKKMKKTRNFIKNLKVWLKIDLILLQKPSTNNSTNKINNKAIVNMEVLERSAK